MPPCERAQGVPAIVWRPTPLGIMSEGQDTVGTKSVFGKDQKALAIAQWSIHIFVNSPGLGTPHNDPPTRPRSQRDTAVFLWNRRGARARLPLTAALLAAD